MSIPRYLSPPYRALSLAVGFAVLASATLPAQTARAVMQQDPACRVLTPASTGGPLPRDPETVVVRWLGHTNYELVYRGNVFLLDAYYGRLPRSHPIGVAPQDFTRATAIFIGHPHFDHISDAAAVAKQTGAPVIGAAPGGEVLSRGGLPERQFTAVKGGEVLRRHRGHGAGPSQRHRHHGAGGIPGEAGGGAADGGAAGSVLGRGDEAGRGGSRARQP